MNKLSKLQHSFQDCVLEPDKRYSTAWISAGGRAKPETQLSAYTYAYTARLNEVLANDYPASAMALGDDLFNPLIRDYIATHPSKHFSLRDFGRHLPAFIARTIQTNDALQEMNWLYELALFEWTLGQAFDAADANLFSEHDMASISPESWPELRFVVHPSVYVLDFNWNIPELWKALTDENPRHIKAEQDSSSWLIWRQQLTTQFRSLQRIEQIAFGKLCEGAYFSDICEALTLVMQENEVPLYAATLLKGWITEDLIVGIHT